MWSLGLGVALWVLALSPGQSPTTPVDDLSAAKSLYAAGSYEEALGRLATATTPEVADDVDQYRALCLLALGRTAETERSLEVLITRRPLFKMSETEVSPRMVTLFHSVRKRLLAGTARQLYAKAKVGFDQKDYAAAASQLRDLMQLLGDDDMQMPADAMGDLKMLGDGFLRLAQAELAAAAQAAAAAPRPAAPPTVVADRPSTGPTVYTAADTDVSAPLDINRAMPPWRPPNAVLGAREYRGILQIVINEQGRVESAVVVEKIVEGYDALLLAATKQWLFRPALKNGQAVKYEKDIPVILSPLAR